MAKSRVMVVEDEGLIAFDLEQMLERLGYEVTASVSSGEQAVWEARHRPLDVILMDIRLNGEIDGIQAAEMIRTTLAVPIIYLTGNSDRVTVNRATLGGTFDFLGKPLKERELPVAIERALLKGRTL